MKNKKDILLAFILGLICGLLMLFITKNLATESAIFAKILPYANYLPIIFPLICAFGMFVVGFLSEVAPSLYQIAKFVLVGGTNFLVDMGVLNILIFVTGVSQGTEQSLFKATSFTVAVINSYFWNKFWVFKRTSTETAGKEFLQFFIVSIAGFLINVGVDKVLVDVTGPLGHIPLKTWAQLAAMISAAVALFWNFAGYKFIVFDTKKEEPNGQQPSAL